MKTFRAPLVSDPQLRKVVADIAEAAGRSDPYAEQDYLHTAPAKVRAGMLVMADGADWNPGSGEGLYRRNKANSAWVFIG